MTYYADRAVAANSWAVLGSVMLNDTVELIRLNPVTKHANITKTQKIVSIMQSFLSQLPLTLGGAVIINLCANSIDSYEILAASTLVAAGTLLLSSGSVKVSLLDRSMDFFGRLAIAAGSSILFQTSITTT